MLPLNKIYLLCIWVLLLYGGNNPVLWAQDYLSSEQALQKFNEIGDKIIQTFPEHELYVSRKSAFTEKELTLYLEQHFERLRLLKQIEQEYRLKLFNYLDVGSWFRRMGMLKESNNLLLDYFEEYEHCKPLLSEKENEPYYNLNIYGRGSLADNYAKLGILDSAEIHHKINVAFAKSQPTIFYPSTLNNYGLFVYTQKKDTESALALFEEAYTLCKAQFKEHTLLGSIRDNIADIYVDQRQYKKAAELYEQNFDFFRQVRNEKEGQYDIPRLISSAAQAIHLHLILEENKLAVALYKQLYAFLSIQLKAPFEIETEAKLELLLLDAEILKLQNKEGMAYQKVLQVKSLTDSIYNEKEKTNALWNQVLSNISINRIKEKASWEQLQKENELARKQLILWLTLLTSIIVIGFFIVLVGRHRMKSIQAKDKQLLAEQALFITSEKNARLNAEVDSKKRDVSDLALNLKSQYHWTELIYKRFEEIRAAEAADRPALMNELELELKNKNDYDKETKVFFEKVDALSDSFYKELKKRFPDLSKTELRICSMIRLKIDSRQIANLQNISAVSVNKSRYRIRKKMNLDREVSLDAFIQNL